MAGEPRRGGVPEPFRAGGVDAGGEGLEMPPPSTVGRGRGLDGAPALTAMPLGRFLGWKRRDIGGSLLRGRGGSGAVAAAADPLREEAEEEADKDDKPWDWDWDVDMVGCD